VKPNTVRTLVGVLVVALLLSIVELSCVADERAATAARPVRHVDAVPSELPPSLEDVEASPTPLLTR
jgi:hypothetical protein